MGYAVLIALLAAGDLGLKWLIEKQEPEEFPKPLRHTGGRILIYRHHNPGFPFGFLQKYGQLVRTVPLVITSALGGVLCYMTQQEKTGQKTAQKLGLALVIGGSLSNLYDRFIRRYVVDYFSFQFGILKKVIFNLGDLCVFSGSGMLMIVQLAAEIREKLLEK